MIIDLDETDAPPLAAHYDVCISGAGVAGIVVATRLAELGRRVLLLEAGGLFPTDRSQKVYQGDIIGHDYYDLDVARLRFLGGSSGHWAGWCRPLDAHDFARRAHIPGSGWPIDITAIEPYVPAARGILELDEFPPNAPLAGADGLLSEAFFRYSGNGDPVRFVEKYKDALAASRMIDVLLNANVVAAVRNTENGRLNHFVFRGYGNEARAHSGSATLFVLAMGGIENARALLNADRASATGLGNEHGLVGRYFTEHPVFNVGYYVLDRKHRGFGTDRRFVSPTPALMEMEGIGNSGARMQPVGEEPSLLTKAKEELRALLCASDVTADLVTRFRHSFKCGLRKGYTNQEIPFDRAGRIQIATEQMPNPESRVLLSSDRDRFGLNRAALDWRLTFKEKTNMRDRHRKLLCPGKHRPREAVRLAARGRREFPDLRRR